MMRYSLSRLFHFIEVLNCYYHNICRAIPLDGDYYFEMKS